MLTTPGAAFAEPTATEGRPTGRPVRPIAHQDAAAGVVHRFRDVVEAVPDEVAVVDESGAVTFRELAGHAARIMASVRVTTATHPVPRPARPGERPPAPAPGPEPVAVLHPHDAGAVAAILGVIASGHPVLVLDPRTPAPRLASFLERTGARVVVAGAATGSTALDLAERVVRTDTGPRTGDPAALWAAPPAPDAPAALAFTSGSTGTPKVVVNDHRMLVRDAWVNSAGTGCYGADDVVAHTLPMAFHAGLMATVAGLVTGTTMRLYDVRGRGVEELPGFVAAAGATVLHTSPAILRALTGSGPDPALLATLRSLTIAGEAAHGRDVEAARRLLPGCTIRNRYGSSETGLIAEFALAPGEPVPDGPLPVGHGVGDTVLGLLREDGTPAPPGEPGTVTVTARETATGYWADPAATGAAFTVHPDGTRTYRTSDVGRLDDDGRLHLLGRRDHSVKIRGHLVEPGEVDAALFALDGVAEAVTIGVARPSDGLTRLVAYVVPAGERPAADLRRALHETLPGYMVPEQIVLLDALPRTERGKLDRSRLPAVTNAERTGAVDGFTEWQRVVSLVWLKVLPVEHLGLDDDFFELGGDSLAAESLIQLMVAELGVPAEEASTRLLVEAPTLGAFADRLRRRGDATGGTLIPVQPGGTRPPLFVVAGGGGLGLAFVPLARHLGPDQPVYALQQHAMERRGLPDWTVARHARRHLATIRTVQPAGPYRLAGHSFGGIVALEMAHRLRRAGEEVELLVMLDSFPPDPDLHADDRGLSRFAKAKETLGMATTGLRTGDGADYWRFFHQSQILHRHYRCDPWPGRTLVVVADSPEKPQRSAWEPHLTGDWELVEVTGDHITMNREPHVRRTAAALSAALARPFKPAAGRDA